MNALPSVLVVDDEQRSVESLARILDEDFEVYTATTTGSARAVLEKEWIQVLLCDHRMPDMSGVEFCAEVREQWPDIVRMIISGYSEPADIIDAINQSGIYRFITKPWHPDDLLQTVHNAVELFRLQRENEQLSLELKLKPSSLSRTIAAKKQILQDRFDWDKGIVRNPQSSMNAVCAAVRDVAPYDVNVLLQGESGTGKELCARALHYDSLRRDKPFLAENCGALPDELLESELFGHKRGAFTGAVEDRVGLLERAHGGTIFLDEIGDISPAFQVKLLRVLQEGEIRPLGSNTRRTVDVRVVAATNKDLEEEVRAGRFRRDLYYRIATFVIEIPPLRQRSEDIEPLAQAVLKDAMAALGKTVQGFTHEALDCLQAYHWPGNVRELQNEVKRMLVLARQDYLGAELISPRILHAAPEELQAEIDLLTGIDGSLKHRVEQLEARILKETLVRHRWNKTRAAEELGLSRVGLRNKLERYGLEQRDGIARNGSPSKS